MLPNRALPVVARFRVIRLGERKGWNIVLTGLAGTLPKTLDTGLPHVATRIRNHEVMTIENHTLARFTPGFVSFALRKACLLSFLDRDDGEERP